MWLKPEKPTESGGIFRYLPASPDIWQHLQISVGIFRYLAASSDICGDLQISADITHTSRKY